MQPQNATPQISLLDFDETKGAAAAYASLERWESDEDGDSSVQEDAASAAFALISSAAVPGARMPSARPLQTQSVSASGQSDDVPLSSNTASSTTTSLGISRTGSGRSKASTRQSSGRSSALASSRQSSGLDSIPEQEVLARMHPTNTDRPRRGSMESSVPDDDSSEKIMEDLNKLKEKYFDDENGQEQVGVASFDPGIPHHDLQTIDERKSSSSSSSSDGSPNKRRGSVLPRDDSSVVLKDSAAKVMESLRDLSVRFGLDLVDDGRSSSKEKSGGTSGQDIPSNELSEMRKSDSQISQHTQPSVRFADDEDSFTKWKKSVKTIYSETTGGDSNAKEKRYAGAVLGAFRILSENSGLTGTSGATSSSMLSSNDPVLRAFVHSTNNTTTSSSISMSSSTDLNSSNAGSSAVGPNILINAFTQKDSGTTKSSSLLQSSGTDNATLSSKTQEKTTSCGGVAVVHPSST